MNHSIARRLLLSLALILVIAGIALAQIGLYWLDNSLRQHTRQQLQAHAESLLSALIRDEDDELVVNERHHDALYLQPFSGQYFIIDIDGHIWRSRSLWDFTWPAQPPPADTLFAGPNNQLLLSYQNTYQLDDSTVSVTVAENYQPVLERFYNARRWGLALGSGTLLLIIAVQWHLIRRALRPLERARRQLVELEQGKRQQLDEQAPDEMQPLVRQINQLLEHIDAQLKRSRSAAGNLGHALKTPLAVLSSLQARPELEQLPELRGILQEQLDMIRQRIERELNRARLAGEQRTGQLFVCDEEIPGLLQLMQQVHGPRVQFSYQAAAGLQVPFDRDDLLELLGNLLDNAGKWANSNALLQLELQPRQLLILVDDDGPGIQPEQRQHAVQRGRRQDEQTPGHGLGLAIVLDIVTALHGELDLQTGSLGGLQVSIRLPVSSQAQK